MHMEQRLGHDLGDVRIHDDAVAARAASTLRARAFTHGHDIYFASGALAAPRAGALLAHELVHAIQQRHGPPGFVQRNGHGEEAAERYDPRQEALTLQEFEDRYPELLAAYNTLGEALDALDTDVEAYGPSGFGARGLESRYRRARDRWEAADGALDQAWSVAGVMAAMVRARQLLVVVNDMRRRLRQTTRTGLGGGAEVTLLDGPHRQAQGAVDRLQRELGRRPETRRVHEAVAEEVERERARREAERAAPQATVGEALVHLRAYVRRNLHAMTDESGRRRYGLAVARLLYADFGSDRQRYIDLFTRLESDSPELYDLILFRGTTISHLADMGVRRLDEHVYREEERAGTHVLLGAWDFDPESGRERDAPGIALLFDILVGVVPLIGQAADARDISGYIYRIGKYEGERESGWTWLGLVGSLLGLIPLAGDAAKSLMAALRRGLTELPVGRLADRTVSIISDLIGDRVLRRFVDASDRLVHNLTLRWTVIQRRILNRWDRIVAAAGPLLTRLSDLTLAELDLVRRAARDHLPRAVTQAGEWLGQLVRSLWVATRLRAAGGAEAVLEVVRGYRARWRLGVEAFHEMWSPTARFLARLEPAERAAVRVQLLRMAAEEPAEIANGIRRLMGEEGGGAAAREAPVGTARGAVAEGAAPRPSRAPAPTGPVPRAASARAEVAAPGSGGGPLTGPLGRPGARLASRARRARDRLGEAWRRLTGSGQSRVAVGQAFAAESAEDAQRVFRELVDRTPGREAAIWENAETGELVVVQGTGNWVHGGVDAPDAPGRWIPTDHYHPELNPHVEYASLDDFRALVHGHGGFDSIQQRVQSLLHYRDPVSGRYYATRFGYDPSYRDHSIGAFFMDVDTADGARVEYRFRDAEELMQHLQSVRRGEPIVHLRPPQTTVPGPASSGVGAPGVRAAEPPSATPPPVPAGPPVQRRRRGPFVDRPRPVAGEARPEPPAPREPVQDLEAEVAREFEEAQVPGHSQQAIPGRPGAAVSAFVEDIFEELDIPGQAFARATPGGAPVPTRFSVGNFAHDHAEMLVSPSRLPRGLEAEVVLVDAHGSVWRADRVDESARIVYEIKPHTAEWRGRGERQARMYARLLDQRDGLPPGTWRYRVVTYDRDRALRVMRQIGWLGPVDLGRATERTLRSIPGIGPATAARIVRARRRLARRWAQQSLEERTFGLDDLATIPGIGPAIIARLRPFVELD